MNQFRHIILRGGREILFSARESESAEDDMKIMTIK